ncbi:MAG: DNA polymerase ligase N-terminal domain-containing protein [Usitatibacter sp.]
MGLARYHAKRHFDRTPEPRGEVVRSAPGSLRFVVQKHAANALHYDFRLEIDGVLKSWAVTKEPAVDPLVKRLAVHTEDHPVEYADFEGDIPESEYGGGHMDIWDRGSWIPAEAPLAAYRRGRLKFELKGTRLKGMWALVRMGNAQTRKRDLWLLMKLEDEAKDAPRRATPRKHMAREGREARR